MVQNSQLKSRVTAKPASIPSSQYAKLTSERENEIHRRLDTLIDPRKPLLDQVKYLSREEFLVYVSRPRSLATKEAENDIILYSDEKLNLATTSNVYHNALGLSLVTVLFSYLGFRECQSGVDCMAGCVLFFLLMCHWSMIEYLAHRFMLHTEDSLPENPTPD